MKTLVLTISLFFSFQMLFGQVSNYTDVFVHKAFHEELINPEGAPEIEVEGTPYLDSVFTNGEFQIKETKYLLPMRFNIFLDAFEVKVDNNILFINMNIVDTVFYNNSPYLFKKMGKKQKTFQILCGSRSADLLKKYSVSFINGSFGVPFKEDVYPHYESKMPEYFYFSEEKGLIKIASFTDLSGIYPDKSDDIKAFIKKGKLKKNNEDDLVILFKYITEL